MSITKFKMFGIILSNRYATSMRCMKHLHCDNHNVIDTRTNSNEKRYRQIIETWSLMVEPYGRLSIKLPFNVKIEPINPNKFTEMNQIFINLYMEMDESLYNSNTIFTDHYHMKVASDFLKKDVTIAGNGYDIIEAKFGEAVVLHCIVQVPPLLDMNINLTEKSGVTIDNVESTSIAIGSESGSVTLNDMKCAGLTQVNSDCGDIQVNKALIGNVHLRTGGDGRITCGKLQGASIQCHSVAGDVLIKALYSENTHITTTRGRVHLGSAHGDVRIVSETGEVSVDAADGNLDVETGKGDIEITLSHHDQVMASSSEGDITIRFPECTSSRVDLTGSTINIDSTIDTVNFKHSNKGHFKCLQGETMEGATSSIIAQSNDGHVNLAVQDWVSSLNLETCDTKQ